MTTDAAGEPASPAAAGQAGRARNLGRRLAWWRSQAPDFKGWWKVLPWALAAAVCLCRVSLGAHFPLDVAAGAALGLFIGGALNLVFGMPGNSPSTARASGSP
jgi:membrane-associated phospholipid phosphatase